MTDFGGISAINNVAECELNISAQIKDSITLTSYDLDELGCTASNFRHQPKRVESKDSGLSGVTQKRSV